MYKQSRLTRCLLALAMATSLVATVTVAPTSAANAASFGISAKKKVLTYEQKKAKYALTLAKKDLKTKEKRLIAAVKTQKKTAAALAKLQGTVTANNARTVKSANKKTLASAIAKATKKNKAAISAAARAQVLRDIAKAKVVRLDARYAWLMQDLSTLECGLGTNVTTTAGSIEHVFECGIVYEVVDGDTAHIKTTKNELVEVRNVGLQTPERRKGSNPPQCGAEAAYKNFVNLLPETTSIVQLRSIKDDYNYWGGMKRATRSIYKLNNATGLFDIDVQAAQVSAGWSMWWPTAAEWTHNQEYLDLMNTAKEAGIGIWDPKLCGPTRGGTPKIWMNSNAPTIGTNSEPIFGEYAILYNDSNSVMDISNWSLRDNSLNFFYDTKTHAWMQKQNHFAVGTTINPGEHLIVYLDNPNKYPLGKNEYEYFNWSRESLPGQLTNPSIRGSYANGDGLYLQDKYGNMRNTITIPCSSTSMCTEPQWVTDIKSKSGQIIPIPVALNKVANVTRDMYNPVVSIVSGENQADTQTALERLGFISAAGKSCDSNLAAGLTSAISATNSCTGVNLAGQRVGIADLSGRIRTTLYVNKASGKNLMPNVVGMTALDARAALLSAGFTGTTVTGDDALIVSAQSIATGTRTLLGTQVTLTVPVG